VKILLLSPYHGGSHQAWAEGYRAYSQHQVQILGLPGRYWKWRMHGGAVTLARRFLEQDWQPDLLLATDMLDLTTFLALTRHRTHHLPAVLYMHENQLTYPLPEHGHRGPMRRQLGERDLHYAFVNYASMMAASLVLFNSAFHRDAFFEALPRLLRHFPEFRELGTVEVLARRSQVLPIGVALEKLAGGAPAAVLDPGRSGSRDQAPLILWNQRWEYDKNPADFFAALYAIKDLGIPFRLALCGQLFGQQPDAFSTALERLPAEIVHAGYADDQAYRAWLWQANITVSTSFHEFFGISVLEAIYCHTFPILPYRLSYPELIPEAYHLRCLYRNQGGLIQRLKWALSRPDEASQVAARLAATVARYDWSILAPRYDALLGDAGA
jgi:glycosyltransferase involved in cell wall biosynthesis